MTTILTDDFKTNLGTIRTAIQTDNHNTFVALGKNSITTAGHTITLETFKLRNEWLPDNMRFETSIGWRWFIQKTKAINEILAINCELIDPTPMITSGVTSGQNLDAIEIENKSHQLHIGTEDGEMMQTRAKQNDWMPDRFKNILTIEKSFTEYIDFGFRTTVPDLNVNEKVYFHFLIATNLIKQSLIHPDERDVSTWYAVDQPKTFLDQYLRKIKK